MLQDDGKVVFLDFGLMSRVDGDIMESFATGIRACLAEDYGTLAFVFQKVGFLTTPLEFREAPGVPYRDVANAEGLAQFEDELRSAMAATEGGSSRFGALAEVLNGKLSKRWKMFTPPYCLLLIRTFLTLEGIAAKVDPDFNIYEISMPWAVKRSLSPQSAEGVGVGALGGGRGVLAAEDAAGCHVRRFLGRQMHTDWEPSRAAEVGDSRIRAAIDVYGCGSPRRALQTGG